MTHIGLQACERGRSLSVARTTCVTALRMLVCLHFGFNFWNLDLKTESAGSVTKAKIRIFTEF